MARVARIITVFSIALTACGDEELQPADHIEIVQQHLNQDDIESATSAVTTGLDSLSGGSAERLDLQGQQLEASARSGNASEALALLEDLSEQYPEQFGYEDYLAISYWLNHARGSDGRLIHCASDGSLGAGVQEVLDAGKARYPRHADTLFRDMEDGGTEFCGSGAGEIESGSETQALESLGYL